MAFDRTFSYAKLHAAFRAIRENGAVIVATNPDAYCPTPDGGLPDCAAMLAAIEACTGARAEAVVGKPSRFMAEAVLARLGVPAADVAVVGDRLTTDVVMGQSVGAAGILVLTGATSAAAASENGVKPDHVLDGISQLLPSDPSMTEFVFMLTHNDVDGRRRASMCSTGSPTAGCATSASRTSGRRPPCSPRSHRARTTRGWR